MTRVNWLIVLVFVPLLTAATVAPTGLTVAFGKAPTLLFKDDFYGTSLDQSKWNPYYWWRDADQGCSIVPNGELEWYQPDDVLVNNGVLQLRAQKRTVITAEGKMYDYTSGVVTTGREHWADPLPDKFAFQYGYAEIRARMPNGRSLWPAFWLMASDQQWPPEIDVLEVLGREPNVVYMTLHYANSDGSHGIASNWWNGPDFSAGWHTFGVDWQPDSIVWNVDGLERGRFSDATYIPHEPMYLALNLAVGGPWAGAPDSSTQFPSYYEIDYAQVWDARPIQTSTAPVRSVLPLILR